MFHNKLKLYPGDLCITFLIIKLWIYFEVNLMKNFMGNQDILIMHKVSCVDLFKNLIDGGRGGRPGLIIMHKVFQTYSDLLKTLSPEPAEASRDLLLMHKVFRGGAKRSPQKVPKMDPENYPKGMHQKPQNPLISLCFGSERDPKRVLKTAPKMSPKRGLIQTYVKTLSPGPRRPGTYYLCIKFSVSFRLN